MYKIKVALTLALLVVNALSSCSGSKNGARPDCRVGLVMPTTGEMAPYGAEGILAARIAVEHAKEKNMRCQPVLFEQDSASEPNQTNIAAATLLAPPKSVQVLVGEINSADTAAMVSQARAATVPVIAPTASAISLTSISNQVFRIWPSDAYEAKKMNDYIVGQGIKKIAVLYIEVPYGEEMAKYFEGEFRGGGGEVTLQGYPKGTVDFKPILQRFQAYDYVYLISYVEDAVLVLKQAFELRSSTQHQFHFFGASVLDSPKLAEKAGVAADGIIYAVVQPGENGDQPTRTRFISEYKAARASVSDRALQSAANEPTFASFHVYDAVTLAFQACDAAAAEGGNRQVVMNYLKNLPPVLGITGRIQFDGKGDLIADRAVVFKTVKNGAITPLVTK